MSAVRGLGQFLPEAALIDALRPLLQDAQWQMRGVAAETLSNTPAGCAVINNMTKLETKAWHSRFARRCRDSTSSATQGTQTALLAGADPTAEVLVYRITDPSGIRIYDYASSSNMVKLLPPTVPGSFAAVVPNSTTYPAAGGPLLSGSWNYRLLASKPTTADVEALIKTPSTAVLASGTVNANLFFVGVPGLNADSARTDPHFQTVLSNVGSTYAQMGVQLGTLTYIDITGPDAIAYTDLNDANLGTLMKLSIDPQAADGAINLFFVHSISGSQSGYIILGESAGIPGVPVRGGSGSGVAVTMADFPNGLVSIGQTIAHESGHWLGLFHTTESAGIAFDPLPDTPECAAVPNDTNHDGIVDAQECAALDATNLMFWTGGAAAQPILTSNQQFVVLRNPVVNVAGTQVTAILLGSVAVSASTLSNPVIVNVPADAVSLTLVGVVPETLTIRNRVYVRATATGANDGTSWADAFTDLQSALAQPAGDIWVARGVYKPTASSDRSIAFKFHPNTAVYGGFAGTETQLSQRDITTSLTVLSGDIDNNDAVTNGVDATTNQIAGNNSYHVVVMDGTTVAGTILASTILDGFTITGGKADGAAPDSSGGGLLCNGSGAAHECSPTLSKLHFSGNFAAYVGGALHNDGSSGGKVSPTVRSATFSGNYAADGGAVYDFLGDASAPSFTNVTFAGNGAASYGGAIYNYQTSGVAALTMTNVTFSGNAAGNGGGAFAHYTCGATLTSTLTNMIAWGDSLSEVVFVCDTPTFKNSILQGSGGSGAWNASFGIDGGGNLAADPKLGPLQDNGGNAPTSLPGAGGSAIDAGLDSACVTAPVSAFDERGTVRPIGAHCDSGAVEASPLLLSVSDNSLYVMGQAVDYVVVLNNSGASSTINGVQLSSTSSSALNLANMSWTCVPVPPAVCTSGSGTFHDVAALPPNVSLTWNVHVPLVAGSTAAKVTFRIVVAGVGAASDTDTLTIFHNGFDGP
jgi:predicted outer membrane repeat protein